MPWKRTGRGFRRSSPAESVSSQAVASSVALDDSGALMVPGRPEGSDSSPYASSSSSAPYPPEVPRRLSSLNAASRNISGNVGEMHKSEITTASGGRDPRDTDTVNSRQRDPSTQELEGDVQSCTMAWWQAGMVMIAETISLGVLSLPSALSVLGLVPGLILLVTLGLLSTYSGYVIGQFKLRHRHIHSMADAGTVLFGRVSGEILGIGQLLFLIFMMGSHILTFGIAMNALTSRATCTVGFMAAGTVLSFILTIPRTLRNLSWWSIAAFISIVAAVVITMVGVTVASPPGPPKMPGEVTLWPPRETPFHAAFLAVANIVFAYAGHVAFFTFISELRHPEEFPKALGLLQGCDICLYVASSVVIYCHAGQFVQSPAIDSTGATVRRVAYGVALPTIMIAGVVNGHVAVKYLYVRILRKGSDRNPSRNDENGQEMVEQGVQRSDRPNREKETAVTATMTNRGNLIYQNTAKARGIWIAINASLWLLAWIIAEGVPVLNDLLGLTSALFASWFTFGLSGFFWFNLNKSSECCWWRWRSWAGNWGKMSSGLVMAMVLVLVGAGLCVMGLYASSMSIRENSLKYPGGRPFSCADNSRHAEMVSGFNDSKAVVDEEPP